MSNHAQIIKLAAARIKSQEDTILTCDAVPRGGDSLILTNLEVRDVNPLAVNVVVVNVPASSSDSLEINLGSRFAEILRERGQAGLN